MCLLILAAYCTVLIPPAYFLIFLLQMFYVYLAMLLKDIVCFQIVYSSLAYWGMCHIEFKKFTNVKCCFMNKMSGSVKLCVWGNLLYVFKAAQCSAEVVKAGIGWC